jgi:hypothetical protein
LSFRTISIVLVFPLVCFFNTRTMDIVRKLDISDSKNGISNEMTRLPVKIRRTHRGRNQHQILRTHTSHKNNSSNCQYSNHVLNTGNIRQYSRHHAYYKGMKVLEKRNIHLIRKGNLHKNETYIGTYNPIFKALYKLYTRQKHIPSRHYTRT